MPRDEHVNCKWFVGHPMYSQCRPLWASPNKGMGVGLSYCGRVYASLNVHHIYNLYIYTNPANCRKYICPWCKPLDRCTLCHMLHRCNRGRNGIHWPLSHRLTSPQLFRVRKSICSQIQNNPECYFKIFFFNKKNQYLHQKPAENSLNIQSNIEPYTTSY